MHESVDGDVHKTVVASEKEVRNCPVASSSSNDEPSSLIPFNDTMRPTICLGRLTHVLA